MKKKKTKYPKITFIIDKFADQVYFFTKEDMREVWNACKKSFVKPNLKALKSGKDEWCIMSQSFDDWFKNNFRKI